MKGPTSLTKLVTMPLLPVFFLYIRIEQVNVGTGINQQGSLGITLIILDLSESFVSILSREGQLFGTSKN